MDGSAVVNEVNTESINLERQDLKGTSQLIVLLGSKEGIKGVSKRLRQYNDFVRVGKGLLIAGSNTGLYTDILQSIPRLSFIRTREIPRRKDRFDDPHAFRAYSIVTYNFNSPTAKQKKRVERLIRRSAAIRLRPGVLLFPVLRSKERRRVLAEEKEHSLLDSKEFNHQLELMGASSMRWSRLKLVDPLDAAQIKEAIERTITRDLFSIESRLQNLRELTKNPQVSTDSLRKKSAAALRRYHILKFKWILAKTLWYYDAEKALKRVYNLGLNTKYLIDERSWALDSG